MSTLGVPIISGSVKIISLEQKNSVITVSKICIVIHVLVECCI